MVFHSAPGTFPGPLLIYSSQHPPRKTQSLFIFPWLLVLRGLCKDKAAQERSIDYIICWPEPGWFFLSHLPGKEEARAVCGAELCFLERKPVTPPQLIASGFSGCPCGHRCMGGMGQDKGSVDHSWGQCKVEPFSNLQREVISDGEVLCHLRNCITVTGTLFIFLTYMSHHLPQALALRQSEEKAVLSPRT